MNDSDNEIDIAFQYREGVLGKDVWIKFPVLNQDATNGFQFFQGAITKMEAFFPDNDTKKPVEYMHYIYFGDSDDGYFDLTDYETTGYLKWTAEEAEQASVYDVDSNKTQPESSSPRVVTPRKEKRTPGTVEQEYSTRTRTIDLCPNNNNNSARARKKPKVKREPGIVGSVRSNISDPLNNEINLEEFGRWLQNIHVGSKNLPISQANARSVINRIRDLVSGNGITYKNWPPGVIFHPQVVALQDDLMAMLADAKAFERRYGRDKGNGWLLQHPIKKLALYKKYIENKRYEQENPVVIS